MKGRVQREHCASDISLYMSSITLQKSLNGCAYNCVDLGCQHLKSVGDRWKWVELQTPSYCFRKKLLPK